MRRERTTYTQGELFPTGAELRDIGIERAVTHADRIYGDWSESAYRFLLTFLREIREGKIFKSEDVVTKSAGIIPVPPDARAWGGIMMRARKAGLIRNVGHAPSEVAAHHKGDKKLWVKV